MTCWTLYWSGTFLRKTFSKCIFPLQSPRSLQLCLCFVSSAFLPFYSCLHHPSFTSLYFPQRQIHHCVFSAVLTCLTMCWRDDVCIHLYQQHNLKWLSCILCMDVWCKVCFNRMCIFIVCIKNPELKCLKLQKKIWHWAKVEHLGYR